MVKYRPRDRNPPTRRTREAGRRRRTMRPSFWLTGRRVGRSSSDASGPALARSERRLAGEAPFGLIPLRIMIPSYVLEAVAIFALLFVQVKIAELRPYVVPRIPSHDVIYYSGEELPRTQDLGGAEAGPTGRSGGEEAHHRTQTIKVARGGSLVPKVVDAPNLKLPSSQDAVANLLAVKPNPGPPPVEGLRSNRPAPNLAATLVAPAPNAIRDYTRNGVQLDSVIAPAPTVSADRRLTMPNLSATLIPPAPSISSDRTLVAPALAPAVIPPAPNVGRDRRQLSQPLNPSVVAPAPSVAARSGAFHSSTRQQCDSSGAGWSQPRAFKFSGTDDQCGRHSPAGLGSGARQCAQSQAEPARAVGDRAAAFERCLARSSPASQWQCSGSFERRWFLRRPRNRAVAAS